jgi:hypothetical protein
MVQIGSIYMMLSFEVPTAKLSKIQKCVCSTVGKSYCSMIVSLAVLLGFMILRVQVQHFLFLFMEHKWL